MERTASYAPADFAEAIRDLARDAHQTLNREPSLSALRGLSRRIRTLEASFEDRAATPIAGWLDRLGRSVRLAAHRARIRRSPCGCA